MSTLEGNNGNIITQQQKLGAGKQHNASTNRKFGNDISNSSRNKTIKIVAGNVKKKNTNAAATSSVQRKPLVNAAVNRERKVNKRNGITAPDSLANLPGGSTKSGIVADDVAGTAVTTVTSITAASSKCDKSAETTVVAVPKLQNERQQPQKDHPALEYQYTGPVDDIDKREEDNPLMVTDYVEGMYEMYREKEQITSVQPTEDMSNQPHLNKTIRAILVDWIIGVHFKFRLLPMTLHLTVNLIDRYLAKVVVERSALQLVGITCLQIACKYEEIYYPGVRSLVAICDNTYGRDDILDCEESILKALEYQITVPTAQHFLVRYLKAAHADEEMIHRACYLLEGSLLNYDLLKYYPSERAAAAVMIARKCSGRNLWSPTLLKFTDYRGEDVVPFARALLEARASDTASLKLAGLKAVDQKYGSERRCNVSTVPLPAPGDLLDE